MPEIVGPRGLRTASLLSGVGWLVTLGDGVGDGDGEDVGEVTGVVIGAVIGPDAPAPHPDAAAMRTSPAADVTQRRIRYFPPRVMSPP